MGKIMAYRGTKSMRERERHTQNRVNCSPGRFEIVINLSSVI